MSETKPFKPPQHTQFSNDAIDFIMRDVSPNTWKIITVAIRKTYGWHKQRDRISYSQFLELTGIKNRSTLSKAIKEAIEKDILNRYEKGDGFEYELNRNYVVQKLDQSNNCTNTSPENGLPASTENGHTKETPLNKKETITPNSVGAPEKTSKNKKEPDLLDGMLHYAKIGEEKEKEGKSWTHREKFPEMLWPLADRCVSFFGKPNKKEVFFWIGELSQWYSFGCIPEDFDNAVEAAEGWTTPLSNPAQLTEKTIKGFAMKRQRDNKKADLSKPKIYIREAKKSVPNPMRR